MYYIIYICIIILFVCIIYLMYVFKFLWHKMNKT